jgi:hypothetical protein
VIKTTGNSAPSLRSTEQIPVALLAISCFVFALYIAVRYASQVPLDEYHFRQAQTALTSYWLGKDGFSFAYETPVTGKPWSIPFEFPIYQYLVALIAKVSPLTLDAVGRLVSFVFLALCLIPVRSIIRSLEIAPAAFWVFTALLFSSPLYVYWGRSFMIETAAVFFAVAAIKYFVDLSLQRNVARSSWLFVVFMTLSVLQKATTGAPVLVVLGAAHLFVIARRASESKSSAGSAEVARNILSIRNIVLAAVYFGIPLAIGLAWTLYSDHVKEFNVIGSHFTSSELRQWNWGKLSQRFSSKLYVGVIWRRMFEHNLGGILGAGLLLVGFFSRIRTDVKLVVLASFGLAMLPLFLFSNLHIRHAYYQSSALIFLIFAVATAMSEALAGSSARRVALPIFTALIVVSNIYQFSSVELPIVRINYDAGNSKVFAVASLLRQQVPAGKEFAAFGLDWDSSLAYLAERKAFTAPETMPGYKAMWMNPDKFVDDSALGAVVLCPSSQLQTPRLRYLVRWSTTDRRWKVGEVHSCYVAMPDSEPESNAIAARPAVCEGGLGAIKRPDSKRPNLIQVDGWTTLSGTRAVAPSAVFVTLAKPGADNPALFEAVQFDRPDVDRDYGRSAGSSGFSTVFNVPGLEGMYSIGVTRLNNGRLESCQFNSPVTLGD